ncbi:MULTISPECIES: hypothetical protein [unclassified Dietzia]|uniref:hypothetical protein n=1 Tax=unclassified Dietzia TaxID=2617939 RepID=UPI000D20ED65|nr:MULTISPECIES: hypothetical protein [unclassified Dietzia]AVZ40866.1 hypothetical protein CT688_16740 [Dietzia sp. JS16-p6b]QGW26492.1 Mas1A [Dietzia sp. DQ12-45-1b]
MAAEATTDGDVWEDRAPEDRAREDTSTVDDDPVEGTDAPRRSTARIVSALVVVALVAACAWLGYLVWSDHREDELRRSAAEDATRLVVQLASYDHADVDANIEAVVAESTPEFADRYREVSEGLRELLANGQGTSTGTVTHAGVQSVDTERAVVLVFLDQEITNVTVPEGRVDASRMVVTLVRGGNRWLLDSAELA